MFRPFECIYCLKHFNEKGNLKIHLRIHTKEKPYICNFEDCQKSFRTKGHRKDHLMRHIRNQ